MQSTGLPVDRVQTKLSLLLIPQQTYQYEITQTNGSVFEIIKILLRLPKYKRYREQCLDRKDQTQNLTKLTHTHTHTHTHIHTHTHTHTHTHAQTDIITKQKIKYLKETPFSFLVLKKYDRNCRSNLIYLSLEIVNLEGKVYYTLFCK